MRIVQSAIGKFRHFELAKELLEEGVLLKFFIALSKSFLGNEGLPLNLIETFPWFETPHKVLHRFGLGSGLMGRVWRRQALKTFDAYVARRLPNCDGMISLSGNGLLTGKRIQERGGFYICDRGSSHIRYEEEILLEEYREWKLPFKGIDPWIIEREVAEYEQADVVMVPSTFAQRSFMEKGVARAKVERITYGMNLKRFYKTQDPPSDAFHILFVGQISLTKGILYLLQAFARLRHCRKRLFVVGGMSSSFKEIFRKYSTEGAEWVGIVAKDRLKDYYSRSHVLVLPSVTEGLGMVLVESMACGCPVIASENTAGPDIFTDGKEGFIVPIRDVRILAERLQQLADDPELQKRFSAAALERFTYLSESRTERERLIKMLTRLHRS